MIPVYRQRDLTVGRQAAAAHTQRDARAGACGGAAVAAETDDDGGGGGGATAFAVASAALPHG